MQQAIQLARANKPVAVEFETSGAVPDHNMKVAIEGCCHGEPDTTYDQLAHLEQQNGFQVDLLLICVDFEAIRNSRDLQCTAPPQTFLRGGHSLWSARVPSLDGLSPYLETKMHSPLAAVGDPPSVPVAVQKPGEIAIDDDEDEGEQATVAKPEGSTAASATMEASNPDEILLDDEEETVEAVRAPAVLPMPSETRFLALDKYLPRRLLEVVDIEIPSSSFSSVLYFDPEWLAINRAFHLWFSTTRQQRSFTLEDEARALVAKDLEWVKTNVKKNEAGLVPVEDFQALSMTALGPWPETENVPAKFQQPSHYPNPQTIAFCRMLDIKDLINR